MDGPGQVGCFGERADHRPIPPRVTKAIRTVGPADEKLLISLFAEIDQAPSAARALAAWTSWRTRSDAERDRREMHVVLAAPDGPAHGYGVIVGLEDGDPVPTLRVAVRAGPQGSNAAVRIIAHLQAEARLAGATVVRIEVGSSGDPVRRACKSLGYWHVGIDGEAAVMLADLADPASDEAAAGRSSRTLECRILGADAHAWQDVLGHARADFYHLPGYVALCARQEGGRGVAVLVADGSRTVLLPLILRSLPDGGLDATSPYGYPGPLATTDDPGFIEVALAGAREVLAAAGVVSAFVRLHPLLNTVPPRSFGSIVRHGDTIAVDLTGPDGDLWAQLRSNHRRDITRAREAGCVARIDPTWSHLADFKAIYRSTMARRDASAYYFFDDAYFDDLRAALPDRLHLCVVEVQGEAAAAGLFVETDGIVEYHLGGTDERHLGLQPSKLMLHFASEWARERGNQWFHLGGGVGGADDSLLRFKLGFSSGRHPFSTVRAVLDAAAYERLVRERAPDLDPADRGGFFPAYRRP